MNEEEAERKEKGGVDVQGDSVALDAIKKYRLNFFRRSGRLVKGKLCLDSGPIMS